MVKGRGKPIGLLPSMIHREQIKRHEKDIRQEWPSLGDDFRHPLQKARSMTSFDEIDAALRSEDARVRWEAAEAAYELVASQPQIAWDIVVSHGDNPLEDVRDAVATCILEHLLEHYFHEYFPLLEREIVSGRTLLGDTFRRCWKFGQAELPENSTRWNKLVDFSRSEMKSNG